MNQSNQLPDVSPPLSSPGSNGAENQSLPPVKPPSAGFLLQLFVVPMVIVVVIVMVCLMFNWLAHLGTRPEDLVDDLKDLNPGSWQKALTIANMLCDRQSRELRQNPQMASRLSGVLDEQLTAADMQSESIKLRMYLCLALGVFEIDEGLPVLIRAAMTERTLDEIDVRKTALEAIARRAENVEGARGAMQSNIKLINALKKAATETTNTPELVDSRAQIRARAAFAFGVIGGNQSCDQLAGMLSDVNATVRYNAATGLARHGDQRCVQRLVEMLRPFDIEADKFEQTTIIRNALRATVMLSQANPNADLSELRTSIDGLLDDPNVDRAIRRGIEVDTRRAIEVLATTQTNRS